MCKIITEKLTPFFLDKCNAVCYNCDNKSGEGRPRGYSMSSQKLELAVERIAKMAHMGVSHKQIAAACGLDIASLEIMLDKEVVKTAIAKLAGDDFDKFETLNQGWDMAENLAINKVVEHLQHVPDPDYALKAASLANRATRHGRHQNNPINVQPNNQAIIQVAIGFADKLQTTFQVHKREVSELKKKDDNFLPPKNVQDLLGTAINPIDKDLQEIGESIAEMGMFAPA